MVFFLIYTFTNLSPFFTDFPRITTETNFSKQQKLLEQIIKHNPDRLRQILKDEEEGELFDINHIYEYSDDKKEYNALQILCTEITNKKEEETLSLPEINEYIECVKILLDYGINVYYRDPDYKATAIDFSVWTGEKQIVEMVLNVYKKDNVSFANIDLLGSIINFYHEEEYVDEEYLDIIELLLDNDVDVNTFDFDTGEPPIYIAAKLKFPEVIKVICDKKAQEVDFDYYVDSKGKTARNLINKYNLYEGTLPNQNVLAYNILYLYLKEKDTSQYIDTYKNYKQDLSNDKKAAFLLRAVQLGCEEIVEYMIQDTMSVFQDYLNLLEIACRKGYYKVVQTLFEETTIRCNMQLVKDLVSRTKSNYQKNDLVDYNQCLSLLLNFWSSIDLNTVDKFGNTLLQYAIKKKHFEMVSILLNQGASLIVPRSKCKFKYVASIV